MDSRQLVQLADSPVHAVLLYGPESADLPSVAQLLTKSWLGLPGSRAVEAFERGTNPDVLVIHPRGASRNIVIKAISPTTNCPKEWDNVQPMTDFLRMPPLYSCHKVVHIADADRLVSEAVNSLLKPLEEPSEYTKIVLTTTEISRIRPTVLSRCMVLPVGTTKSDANEFAHLPERFQVAVGHDQKVMRLIAPTSTLSHDYLALLDRIFELRPQHCLVVSDAIRQLSEQFDGVLKLGARGMNAKLIEWIATSMLRSEGDRGGHLNSMVEAHKRIVGNGAPQLVFDALCMDLVTVR